MVAECPAMMLAMLEAMKSRIGACGIPCRPDGRYALADRRQWLRPLGILALGAPLMAVGLRLGRGFHDGFGQRGMQG